MRWAERPPAVPRSNSRPSGPCWGLREGLPGARNTAAVTARPARGCNQEPGPLALSHEHHAELPSLLEDFTLLGMARGTGPARGISAARGTPGRGGGLLAILERLVDGLVSLFQRPDGLRAVQTVLGVLVHPGQLLGGHHPHVEAPQVLFAQVLGMALGGNLDRGGTERSARQSETDWRGGELGCGSGRVLRGGQEVVTFGAVREPPGPCPARPVSSTSRSALRCGLRGMNQRAFGRSAVSRRPRPSRNAINLAAASPSSGP